MRAGVIEHEVGVRLAQYSRQRPASGSVAGGTSQRTDAGVSRSERVERDRAVAVCPLSVLALPPLAREHSVNEVLANMADPAAVWLRLEELPSVAAAVPGLAVILRWARQRA